MLYIYIYIICHISYNTSGNEHPDSSEQRRSVDPGSTADCSTPLAAPDRPGFDWVYAWPD